VKTCPVFLSAEGVQLEHFTIEMPYLFCRAGMVKDLPAAAGREARLKTCKPTFSAVLTLQFYDDISFVIRSKPV